MPNPRARPQSRRGKKHRMNAADALAIQQWFVAKGLPLAKLKKAGKRLIKANVTNEEVAAIVRRILRRSPKRK